jgi:O-antigen/teichoic acid export membrane protein
MSQGLGFLFLPLLSRLYGPEEFGLFYSFVGISQTLGLISTLKYEKAIILPKKKEKAETTLLLTLMIIGVYSMLIFLILGVVNFLNVNLNIATHIALLIPFNIAVYSSTSAIILWFQREEKFKAISLLGISQSLLVILISILSAYCKVGQNGLIIGYILGYLIPLLYTIWINFNQLRQIYYSNTKETLREIFIEYIDFPKYYLLYDLCTLGTLYLTPIIIASYYSQTECGLFSMAYKILMTPIVIITYSVYNVFMVEARKELEAKRNFSQLYLSTLKKMSLMAFGIYIVSFFFGNLIITTFLGEKWQNIEVYIKILSVILFFEFIIFVFRSNTYILVQKQRTGMMIQFIGSSLSLLCLVLLAPFGIEIAIKSFAFVAALFAIINLSVTYRLSQGKKIPYLS